MAKVTLNENFFPCARPLDASTTDLTENVKLADRLVRIAAQVFWLKKGMARFSGHFSEAGGTYSIEIWRKGRLLRTVRFDDLGFSGTLFVDIEERLALAMGTDILGQLYQAEAQDPEELEPLGMTLQGTRDMPSLKIQSKKADRHFMILKQMRESREKVVMRLLDYLEGAGR